MRMVHGPRARAPHTRSDRHARTSATCGLRHRHPPGAVDPESGAQDPVTADGWAWSWGAAGRAGTGDITIVNTRNTPSPDTFVALCGLTHCTASVRPTRAREVRAVRGAAHGYRVRFGGTRSGFLPVPAEQ